MNILFLCHYFPPEVNAPASRTFEHCREWVRQGHKVTVITCVPNHPRGEVYPGYKNRLYQTENIEGVEVIRLWTYLAANEGFAKRTLNYVSYMLAATLMAPFLKKHDLLISTSPQFFCGLAGYLLSRIKRVPWVLEIRDLWPESILAVGAIKNKMIIKLLQGLEDFVYKKSDRIVSVTDSFKRYMVAKGVAAEKVYVIKNGVNLDFYKADNIDTSLKSSLGLADKFVISYVGTHGMAHKLRTLLEAAKMLEKHTSIHFLLVGDGADKENLSKLRDQWNLTNVTMLEQQPKTEMPKIWGLTDISAVCLKKSDLFKTVIPSKIFESMAMSKPILLGVDGESREIIEQSGAGLYFEPENSQMLADIILKLYQENDAYIKLARCGRDYVAQNFDRKVLAHRYIEMMSSLENLALDAAEENL